MEWKTPQIFPSQPGLRCWTRGYGLREWRKKLVHPPSVRSIQLQETSFPTSNHKNTRNETAEANVQSSLFLEGRGQSTTHLFRALLGIHVGLVVKVLDFVDSWHQSSALEDGYRVTGSRVRGRGRGHGEREEVVMLLSFTDARPPRLCLASVHKVWRPLQLPREK